MTQRHSIRYIALAAAASIFTLVGVNAQAAVPAGNYQDHVLPSTTRHTAGDQANNVDAASRTVPSHPSVARGNYQDHVLPRTTRRTAHQQAVDGKRAASSGAALKERGERS